MAWLAALRERRAEWWWLAAAFGVSGVADLLTYGQHPLVEPWLMASVYQVGQVGILMLVLAMHEEAPTYIGLLVAVGLLTVLTEGVTGPTLLLDMVAAGCVVSVVWDKPLGLLRWSLLVAFGGGLLAWIAYVIAPGWATWFGYQGVRAVSLGLFCWASANPELRLAH